MPVVPASPTHGSMSLANYLGIYLAFRWRRHCMHLHRARIALHSRGLAALLQRRTTPLPPRAIPATRSPAQLNIGPGSQPFSTATATAPSRKILIIDTEPPRPDRDSGSVRCQHLLQLLVSLGYAVTLHCEGRAPSDEEVAELRTLGVTTSPRSGPDPHWLREGDQDFCAVIVSRYHLALAWLPLLRRLLPRSRLILDTVDLHHLRERREADLHGNAGLRRVASVTRNYELRAIAQADSVWVVSQTEQNYLREHAPECEVAVIPNLHAVASEVAPFAGRAGFLFVGGGRHPPNLDAVQWLLQAIFPQIRARLPEAVLHLVGAGLAEALRIDPRDYPGVHFHGHLPSLTPLLSSCRVSLAPLRFGAGVKGKVSEAMAHGLPVVATPIAAEGMELHAGTEALIASDADAVADAAVRAHQDATLWQRLSENGRALAQRRFSLQRARDRLAELLP